MKNIYVFLGLFLFFVLGCHEREILVIVDQPYRSAYGGYNYFDPPAAVYQIPASNYGQGGYYNGVIEYNIE